MFIWEGEDFPRSIRPFFTRPEIIETLVVAGIQWYPFSIKGTYSFIHFLSLFQIERALYWNNYQIQDSDVEHYAEALWGTQRTPRMHIYDPNCPVHGSRRKLFRKRRQLMDINSFAHSLDEQDNLQLLTSDSYFAKALRKQQRAKVVGGQGIHLIRSKRKIQQNLMIISCAFLFLFIGTSHAASSILIWSLGFHGLQYLQTSVNGRIGSDALSAYYLSLALSSLFVPTFVVSRLGSKLTLIAGKTYLKTIQLFLKPLGYTLFICSPIIFLVTTL